VKTVEVSFSSLRDCTRSNGRTHFGSLSYEMLRSSTFWSILHVPFLKY